MFLISAATFGLLVCAAYLGLKRIAFYSRPTPVCYIVTMLVGITVETILVLGVGSGMWGIAIIHLVTIYSGLGYAMHLVGDLDYYTTPYRRHLQSPQYQVPAEDDPNWLEYKFRP